MSDELALRRAFGELIAEYGHLSDLEMRRAFSEAMQSWEREEQWQTPNKGKKWTDEELRVILSDPPTRDNCIKHAKAFGRGYGSLEMIYRWAAASDKDIEERGRADDAFVQQVKRVAKELGWRV